MSLNTYKPKTDVSQRFNITNLLNKTVGYPANTEIKNEGLEKYAVSDQGRKNIYNGIANAMGQLNNSYGSGGLTKSMVDATLSNSPYGVEINNPNKGSTDNPFAFCTTMVSFSVGRWLYGGMLEINLLSHYPVLPDCECCAVLQNP